MELNELKNLLRESGVVGAGGAGFPSYAKLTDKADTIILNCAECEPLLKVHRQVLEECTYEVLSAMDKIVKASGATSGIIAIKAHYKAAIKALESEISEFHNKYHRKSNAANTKNDNNIMYQKYITKYNSSVDYISRDDFNNSVNDTK